MPELVVVTRPPTQTSGKVAQASPQAQRWGQGEVRDGLREGTAELRVQGPGSRVQKISTRLPAPAEAGFAGNNLLSLQASHTRKDRDK